jgi:hypothetical protein
MSINHAQQPDNGSLLSELSEYASSSLDLDSIAYGENIEVTIE